MDIVFYATKETCAIKLTRVKPVIIVVNKMMVKGEIANQLGIKGYYKNCHLNKYQRW